MNKVSVCKNLVMHVNKTNLCLWHKRPGHPSKRVMKSMFKIMHVKIDLSDFSFHEDCHFDKHKQNRVPSSSSRASRVLELVHSDLWSPAPIVSKKGFKFYLHFLDDYFKFT